MHRRQKTRSPLAEGILWSSTAKSSRAEGQDRLCAL